MRIPRFHCPSARTGRPGEPVVLEARESRHLATVLRRGPGDRGRLLPGDGREWEGVVIDAEAERAVVRLEREVEAGERSGSEAGRFRAVETVVAVALARGGAFELALEHLTELGADTIVPLQCARCVVRVTPPGERERKHERWVRILEAAAKQSGRRILPRLLPILQWECWIEEQLADPPGQAAGVTEPSKDSATVFPLHTGLWVATPGGESPSLFEEVTGWLEEHDADENAGEGAGRRVRVVCAIGPEGGFTPEEIGFALDRGARSAWLADHVLRVPTAAATAMTAIRLAILSRRP